MPSYKKGQKKDWGNYRPVSLSSVLGKAILSVIIWQIQDAKVIRSSQHRFMNSRSCLTNVIFCYDKVIHLVDKWEAVDVIYLDFGKTFDTFSQQSSEEAGCSRLG